jgi:hypothetical protein
MVAFIRSNQEGDPLLLKALQALSLGNSEHPNLAEQVSPHHDGLNHVNGQLPEIIDLLDDLILNERLFHLLHRPSPR